MHLFCFNACIEGKETRDVEIIEQKSQKNVACDIDISLYLLVLTVLYLTYTVGTINNLIILINIISNIQCSSVN